MALFNQLRNLIMWSPMILSILADAKIATRRIQSLLDAEELSFEPQIDMKAPDAVLMEHGSFSWDSLDSPKEETENMSGYKKHDTPVELKELNNVPLEELSKKSCQTILKDVHLKIPRGKLIAIVGPIGSGKSSLLSAIIGQMQPIDKEAKVVLQNSVGTSLLFPLDEFI